MERNIIVRPFYRWVFIVLVGWYLSVCLIHFLSHRSLWNDELAVLASIRFMKPSEIFSQPLHTCQAFPHLYLFCIQSFAKFFGNSIWCLRFFPFVSMLLAFGIWLKIGNQELKVPAERLTFLLCWVASIPLIYYSAELKQYSMDVLISGLFVFFLSQQDRMSRFFDGRLYGFLLTVLPATVLFSYPAYFFLIFPLWNLIVKYQREHNGLRYIFLYLMSLLVFVASSYYFDVRLRPIDDVTKGYNDYFISLRSWQDFFQTFGEGVNNLFSRWFVELPKIFRKLARIFMVFGLIHLFVSFFAYVKRGGKLLLSVGTIALIVFLEMAVAAAMSKYPFGVPRTALFLSPMLLILTVQGISAIKKFNHYAYYAVHGSFVIYLITVAIGIFKIVTTQPLTSIPVIWIS